MGFNTKQGRETDGKFGKALYGGGGADYENRNGPPAPSAPVYDCDELNDSLGRESRFDAVAYANVRDNGDQGDGEYIEESIEVIEENGEPVVILKRETTRFIFDSFVYPDNEGGDEADTLAADAFNAGDREVDAAAAETAQAAALKEAEANILVSTYDEDSDFDDLRYWLKSSAEDEDIDLDGIEVREERVVEFSDQTTDLAESAQSKLDALWAEADELVVDADGELSRASDLDEDGFRIDRGD